MGRRSAGAALFVLLVASLLILSARPAAACSCQRLSDADALDEADVVFAGEVVEVQRPPDIQISPGSYRATTKPTRLLFDVSLVYKGDVSDRADIATPRGGGSCGLELAGRGPFLVFATVVSEESTWPGIELTDGELFSHLCTRTAPVDSFPVMERFGVGSPPGAAATIGASADIGDAEYGGRLVVPIAVATAVVLVLAGGVLLVRRARRT